MNDQMKIFYFYINENNEISSVKSEFQNLENNSVSKERLLYLIKKNQFNKLNHQLISLLKFDINIDSSEIKSFISNNLNNNYLESIKILDKIEFKCNFKLLRNFNSLFFLYKLKENSNKSSTRRITLNNKKQKTRRKNKLNM